MFSEIDQQTLDINWYFTNGKHVGFVASAGGKLPYSVAKSDDYNIVQSFFEDFPITSKVAINPKLSTIISSAVNEQYLADFKYMAERGIYAFDKTVLGIFSDTNYHLVAWPMSPVKISEVSLAIKLLLSRTVFNGDVMPITMDVSLML